MAGDPLDLTRAVRSRVCRPRLHPLQFDEVGLPALLHWYALGLVGRSGLTVSVHSDSGMPERR